MKQFTGAELAASYKALRDACVSLRQAIEDGCDMEDCLISSEALGRSMEELPDPLRCLMPGEGDQDEDPRAALSALQDEHRKMAAALVRRAAQERDKVADEHRRAGAVRAYRGEKASEPRYHDRRV